MIRAAILSISVLASIVAGPEVAAQRAPVSIRFEGTSLRAALDSLMQRFGVSIVYLDRDVEGRSVSARCDRCSLAEALDRTLEGTALTWVQAGNQVIITRRSVPPEPALATLSGGVLDSLTGRPLAGANVLLQDTAAGRLLRWCPANDYGFFSLRRLPPGTYELVVRALGYHQARRTVTVRPPADIHLDIAMGSEEIRMQEITIEGHRTALLSSGEYARGVYIRAAPTDQTQYLLDGARIYNPSHFGSVLSTFNADVLADVDVTTGGLPPRYGGRIGGYLDLSMRDGSRQKLSGSAGTGSLGSHVALEGPLAPRTAFLISWRRGYPDALVPFLSQYGAPSPLGTTELIARVNHRLSGSQQIAASAYASGDAYSSWTENAGWQLSNNFRWDNRAASIRWSGIASPSLFLAASAVYSGYDFSLEHIGGAREPEGSLIVALSESSIRDYSLRADAEHFYDEHHTVRGGVELVHRRIAGEIQRFSTQIAPLSLGGAGTWEFSVYLQDQWVLMPRVSAGLGARATTYTGPEGSYSAVDPRFSLLVALDDDTRLYGAFTSVHQFVHTYRNSGVFLLYPPNFFYPSTEAVRPTAAVQASLGIQTGADGNVYVFSAESFYRVTHNVHGFLAPSPAEPPATLTDAMRLGSGLGYGIELAVRKRLGDLRGSVSYTLAWAKETYADVNGGNSIASPFDRRHELQGSLSWIPAEGWTVGALCVLTGYEAQAVQSTAPSVDHSFGGVETTGLRAPVDANGSRLPGFQRLELELARTFAASAALCTISLRLLNAYGLTDPYDLALFGAPDGTMAWSARLRDLKFFPLFPTLEVTVRF